ncbi:hypothetical protein [Aureimonas leprariae]|uniref:Uncharacterized protein n=1 Tax=Plantimonas leprariae TaxID=2615207 RepID=A0A7V7PLX6_9HYPH|nr:hypothetical protein [Aureimonas leprariae]KAB0677549.1 hypothetical protein F6X38_17905 [Aureimonas leprariae]
MTRPAIAMWKQSSRRRLQLWEGNGRFGERLFATLDRQPNGTWLGSYGGEHDLSFVTREAGIEALSRRAAADHGVAVWTTTRIIVSYASSQPTTT